LGIAVASISLLNAPHDAIFYISQMNTGFIGGVTKFAIAFPLTYHTLAGFRHLVWDYKGTGLSSLDLVNKTGMVIVGASALISLVLAFLSF